MNDGSDSPPRESRRARKVGRIPLIIGAGVVVLVVLGSVLAWRASARTNKVALVSSPKPVTASPAEARPFRLVHMYVGALRPWVDARVGPQYIAAYARTVLVRPGAVVKKGDVLATLDCGYPHLQAATIASHAKAIAANQLALAHQAERTRSLLAGGFVAANDSELITAGSDSQAHELDSQKANLARSDLDVNDCILRAPFDGEVSARLVDPGTFVRPGTEVIGVVDRRTVRMTADAPETDFDAIAPGTEVRVRVVSIGLDRSATISRRAPNADPGTRTVHFEADMNNSDRRIPVDTTGEVYVALGNPVPATAVPLRAVTISGEKAALYTVEGNAAKKHVFKELGEIGPDAFFSVDDLQPGSLVVIEGGALLNDGDRVGAKVERTPTPAEGP